MRMRFWLVRTPRWRASSPSPRCPARPVTARPASAVTGLGISAYSKYKATDLDFLKFIESDDIQRNDLNQGTLVEVVTALYSDPALVKKFPYLPTLLASIQTAVPRPVTPYYPGVTEAIETNAYAALQGQVSTQQALTNMQAAIKSATAG